ncbi:dehydrogenase/reductase SDR family member 9 isoform X1 [Zonotrichia albicollis]|uniref:dehydrogenase/reductase SDR family member 9 isoform X1 n=1 Tax=Zonotrichia albicollis TaxID=44394 RepID=UPI003D8118BB
MILLLQYFFMLATDLVLAMTLSCLFYAFACASIALLTCCAIVFSFGSTERSADVKGRAIVILVSNSSIGRMFARNLDRAGFGVSAAQWPAREERTVTQECPSNKEVAQLHLTEDEYQKTVKTFIESHLSLKGMYGQMRKPSILIWDEGAADTQASCEGRSAPRAPRRNRLLRTAALCISVLCHPVTCVLTLLKRSPQLLVPLLKPRK